MRQLSVTKILLGLNIFVFALMVGFGGPSILTVSDPETAIRTALAFGANFGPLTLHGQLWRLVTSMFVHFGILHLGMNMWCLWQLGGLCEQILGKARYLGLYFLTGVGGSLASLFFNPVVVSAGASGAIFGLAGVLVAVLYLRKDLFPAEARSALLSNMLFFVVLNLALGASIPGIDMSAHVGGLVTGLAAGAGVSLTSSRFRG